MRSCREKGYEKGRSILADVGRQIFSQQRLLSLELTKGGTDTQIEKIQKNIKCLEYDRDKLDARYATDRFEEMVRMDDVNVEELK